MKTNNTTGNKNTKKEFQFMMDCYVKLIRTYVEVCGMTVSEATEVAHKDLLSGQFENMMLTAAKQM